VTVKVLRIATSNDSHHALPLEERGWYIAGQMLSDAAGEPVETIVRSCWPTETFPPLLERWLNELDPDIVLIQVNNFWYAHDSIPLWFERKFGRAGKKLTDVGLKAGKQKWFAESRPYIAAHRTFLRVMPAATHFTIEQVASCMEEAIRRVIAHEGPVLLVRGNDDWAKHPLTGRRHNNLNRSRNREMTRRMAEICERYRVPYYQRPTIGEAELREMLGSAQFHASPEGERVSGELDGAAMIKAWRAARG
jgi:hypothetical protein